MNTILATLIPTGGIFRVNITSADATGNWSLVRSVVGNPQASYTLYSGANPAGIDPKTGLYSWIYLDMGDGSVEPLDQTKSYTYTFTSASGSVTSDPQSAACQMTLEMDPYLVVVFKAFKAGFTSLRRPATFQNNPTIQIAMPLTGVPTLPVIAIAPVHMEQAQVPIGHGVNTSGGTSNFYTIQEQVTRRYVVSVHAMTPDERDYYTTAVVLIFKSMLTEILGQLGMNVSHRFQTASSQVVDIEPGFYYSESMLEFQGQFVAGITTNYGVIENVAVSVNDSELFTDPVNAGLAAFGPYLTMDEYIPDINPLDGLGGLKFPLATAGQDINPLPPGTVNAGLDYYGEFINLDEYDLDEDYLDAPFGPFPNDIGPNTPLQPLPPNVVNQGLDYFAGLSAWDDWNPDTDPVL